MAIYYEEEKVWDPGLFDDPPRNWLVSSVGALLYPWGRSFGEGGGNQVLLIRRIEDGLWGFPAGRIKESDISAEAAMSREVLEETRIDIMPGQFELVRRLYDPDGKRVRFLYMAQIPRAVSREIADRIRDSGGSTTFGELPIEPPTDETNKMALVALSLSMWQKENYSFIKPEVIVNILNYLGVRHWHTRL